MDLPRHHTMGRGFTLVELLIVVVILSVLASIVVPSFKVSNSQTAESFILANVKIVQSAIDRYRVEHGVYPQATEATSSCSTNSGGKSSSEPAAMQNFINRMRLYTNKEGEACNSRSNGKFMLGPYLSKPIPINPLCNFGHIYVHSSTDTKPSENKQFGWAYNYSTGEFFALRAAEGCSKESGQGSLSYVFLVLLTVWRLASHFSRRNRPKISVEVYQH